MASVSASVNCCVCKTHVSAGNRRVLNGPREVESNKKVVDFLNKCCCNPLNAPSFICKSCFSTVEKAHKHVQSAKLTIDSLRQSLDLPLAQLELNSTVYRHPCFGPVAISVHVRDSQTFYYKVLASSRTICGVNEPFYDLIGSLKIQTGSFANTRKVSKVTRLSLPLSDY